jgi:hypothetical protein
MLTKKDQPFNWTTECQEAFNMLKQKFSETPVLLMPNPEKPFTIESDASKFASGAVLHQQDINGDWHPYRYILHSFNQTERNYKIYDHELFRIIRVLEAWHHYLQGSRHSVTILSDHKNLTYFCTAQKLNRRQVRWSILLSLYDMKIVHMPGSKMVQSDALSRRADLHLNEDNDNKDMTLLPDTLFVKTINTETHGLLVTALMKDDLVKSAVEALKTRGIPPIKSALTNWKLKDCYIRNTTSDSDRFRTGFRQQAQPLSTFHFLSISNILPRSLTVAYSQPSVIAPIPAYCNRDFRRGTPS